MAGKHSAIDRLLTDIKDLLAIVELSSTVNNMASTIESLRVKVDSMSLAVDSLNAKADQVATTIGNLSEKMDKIVTTVEVLRLALQRESYFQDGQGPFVKSPMW
ncbi:uncharacterized protein EURHEDRAFT_417854 [Aspergillus ruber CBS 135680]|uniref:Uncharacterized protein n=1 Tax=Aspergillus ruber (strain CBS 135680) TaxID=1388766 RepID=A0A017RZD1_ASPRC|nr:uncharacterized protein EURHEDRAFT_417854 [Aspergillus ruber CBS 135680]EYE90017.1 hypothetical protein EURHEDRAFT_417854 [Aspergillus ruber CBS 135680]